MKTYITFGQVHTHSINGITFDKDCVAVIDGPSCHENRERAFQLFGRKFCFEYCDKEFENVDMRHFPRGLIEV